MKGQLVDVVAAVRVDVLLVNARAFSSSCFFYLVCFLTRLFVWPVFPPAISIVSNADVSTCRYI